MLPNGAASVLFLFAALSPGFCTTGPSCGINHVIPEVRSSRSSRWPPREC